VTDAPNLYQKARTDVATMLGYDLDALSPEQSTRVDVATALRVLLDTQSGRLVRGESLDARELLMASEALSRLLPPLREPAAGPREDPREVMWQIYKTMRERGELNLRKPDEGPLQAKIDELQAEIAALKAGSSAHAPITPLLSDIVPPSERAECDSGPPVGLDDPPQRSTTVIEAVPNPPAASVAPAPRPAAPAYDYNKERGWRDHVLPDGTITSTPMSRGRWWGPV
jgi:hypothetical protein